MTQDKINPELVAEFKAHDKHTSSLAVGWEHHVGIWKADDDQPAALIKGLPKGVYNLSFSEDGKSLAMGAADGWVRVWRV